MGAFQNAHSDAGRIYADAGANIANTINQWAARRERQQEAQKRELQNAKLAEQFFKINPEALPAAGYVNFEQFAGQSAPDKIASFAAFQMSESLKQVPDNVMFQTDPVSGKRFATFGNQMQPSGYDPAIAGTNMDPQADANLRKTNKEIELLDKKINSQGAETNPMTAMLRQMAGGDREKQMEALTEMEDEILYLEKKVGKGDKGWGPDFLGIGDRELKLKQLKQARENLRQELGLKESKTSETSTSGGTALKWNPETGEFE